MLECHLSCICWYERNMKEKRIMDYLRWERASKPDLLYQKLGYSVAIMANRYNQFLSLPLSSERQMPLFD